MRLSTALRQNPSRSDQKIYQHSWWDNEELKDKVVYQPDVDLTLERYEFTGENGELEALRFIQKWWTEHPVDETYKPPNRKTGEEQTDEITEKVKNDH